MLKNRLEKALKRVEFLMKTSSPAQNCGVMTNYHPENIECALDNFLRDLDTPYVDLVLMHYPCIFA